MTNTSNQLCPECLDAENEKNLDIKCVLNKLTSEKKDELSPSELRYLCLCLCLTCRYEVAFRIHRNRRPTIEEIAKKDPDIMRKAKNISSEMSEKVHRYVKQLMGIQDERRRIPPWSRVVLFLQNEGCQKQQPSPNSNLRNKRYVFIVNFQGKRAKNDINKALKQIGIEVETIMRIEYEQ